MDIKIISVKPLEKYKIHAVFNDGIEGVYDLGDMAGKGVFKIWEQPEYFNKVYINPENNAIAWNDQLEVDTLNCYLTIRGISFEEYKALNKDQQYAIG
jgi:Protein of unknown function (DUF2442)